MRVVTHSLSICFSMQDAVAPWTFSPNFHVVRSDWTEIIYFQHFNYASVAGAGFSLVCDLSAAAYAARVNFQARSAAGFFAGISLPLNLMLSLLGYVTIKRMMRHQRSYAAAVAPTLIPLSALAWLIRRRVELPNARFGPAPGATAVSVHEHAV